MFEVLEWRLWEPTGSCRARRTTPSSPLAASPIFIGTPLVGPVAFPGRPSRELLRSPQKLSEAGERHVAEWRHGGPRRQQPLDETYGDCPQGKETPRLRRWWHLRWTGVCDHRKQRSEPQPVSKKSPFFGTTATFLFFKKWNLMKIF